ncbi:MAG: phosphoribosylanthranilate isomerase [Firmicutes bacterium]|nr:phosphoribosylanthranilate isomerase [Bacillota bacterium]
MIPVKICGITNWPDALYCQKMGVSALGFVFAPSPRQVTIEQVYPITRRLSPFLIKVGVFVDEAPDRIREIMQDCRLDLAQLHGAETPDVCEFLAGRVIKAFRAGRDHPDPSWKGAPLRGILLDTYVPGVYGGTGQTFDWSLVASYRQLGFPLILAGGLNPDNIGTALQTVRPDGIDLSSGVEARPGIKDPVKIAKLLTALKRR